MRFSMMSAERFGILKYGSTNHSVTEEVVLWPSGLCVGLRSWRPDSIPGSGGTTDWSFSAGW